MEMEELHAAALDYYSNGSPELQRLAWSFFQSMDTNNDGRISSSEFYEFLQQSGYSWIINDPSFFTKLDRNRDRADHHQGTYDLCAACYRIRNFYHYHTYFLDNHVLLRSKRGLPPCASPDLSKNKWFQAYRLFEIAVAAASAAANCTIM
ncbi:unnamed protein product [Prunus armeniaca]|uniref:EF-hand domain-containing protein n=1 Tax=Prunus armeniaca TaxID=36596 RepID=A0A6J5TD82_PRUAR|nr:unnamed protein product [Prunus armeniaca]